MAASKIIRVLIAVAIASWFVACDDESTVAPPPLPPQLSLDVYNSSTGLPSDDVYDIYEDSQGRIWFATQQGLGVLDDGDITIINQADGLIHPNTRAVRELGGKVYVATWGGGVAVYDGASWSTLPIATPGLVNGSVMNITVDAPYLFFATAAGVSQYNPTTGLWRRFTSLLPKPRWTDTNKKILENLEISSIVARTTPRGYEVWMGAVYGGITVWRPEINDFKTYTTANSGLPGKMINAMHYNSTDGLYWIGTAVNGIASVDVPNSTWKHYDQVDGLPSDVVNSITSDQDGVVWVATNKGIAKQNGNGFVGYGKASGLPEERVRKVFVDSQNRVWLGFVDGGAAMIK